MRTANCSPLILFVKSRIHGIDIFLVQSFPKELNGFAKTLEVNDLTLAQELDHIIDIGIITEPKNVVVGGSCLLFWHAQSFATK